MSRRTWRLIKNKLWFFGAFNPQRRTNQYLTQTFNQTVENKVTTPFYAGKLTYSPNRNHILTFSIFGDFTKQDGFLFRINARVPDNGFGTDPDSFRGRIETGGHNYTARLNSTFSPTFIGEFMFGLLKKGAAHVSFSTSLQAARRAHHLSLLSLALAFCCGAAARARRPAPT